MLGRAFRFPLVVIFFTRAQGAGCILPESFGAIVTAKLPNYVQILLLHPIWLFAKSFCVCERHLAMSNLAVGRFCLTTTRQLLALLRSQTLNAKHFSPYSTDVELGISGVVKSSSSINLTDSCVEHLKKFANGEEFLRISVEGGGCSGFSYKFELDSEKGDDDMIFSRDGVQVVTDTDSFELIKGSKIDYETELIKSAFRVIENPQSKINCSCGVSFSID